MPRLTTAEIQHLQDIASRPVPYSIENAREYYTYLAEKGFTYGTLALGVVNNDTPSGQLANQHAKNVAADHDVDMSVGSPGWLAMQQELLRQDAQARRGEGGFDLDYNDYVRIHDNAAKISSDGKLDYKIFTPGIPLKNLEENGEGTLGQIIWDNLVEGGLTDMIGLALWLDGAAGGEGLWQWQRNLIESAFKAIPDWLEQHKKDLFDILDQLKDRLGKLPDDFCWIFDNPDAVFHLLPPWAQDLWNDWNGANSAGAGGGGCPLVLDLGAVGIELLDRARGEGVYWDIDRDGFKEASGWVGKTDGLLAIDANNNGVIDDHGELFGDQTAPGLLNGFEALKAHDSNRDGQITVADANFNKLLVWIDAGSNGMSQAGVHC